PAGLSGAVITLTTLYPASIIVFGVCTPKSGVTIKTILKSLISSLIYIYCQWLLPKRSILQVIVIPKLYVFLEMSISLSFPARYVPALPVNQQSQNRSFSSLPGPALLQQVCKPNIFRRARCLSLQNTEVIAHFCTAFH